MNKIGPIVVIEDDAEDQEILAEIFKTLDYKNPIIYFSDSEEALQFLIDTKIKPFLILSDINMPKLTGFELRQKVHTNEDLNLKCIPYLFFTTTSAQKAIVDAYSQSVQRVPVDPRRLQGRGLDVPWRSHVRLLRARVV